MADGTRNFTKFEDFITRLNENQARLMDVQMIIMAQQIAVHTGSTNIFNRHQHMKISKIIIHQDL